MVCARQENCLLILQLDANATIGKESKKGDPNKRRFNGRQNLTIVNTLDLCKGIITRERVTSVNVEK